MNLAIVYGFANLELKNKLCERDLVITKSVVLENVSNCISDIMSRM